MGRIKIDLPEKVVFNTILNVQIGDINYGGHMSNDAYLKLAHEARIRFLAEHGWSEKDIDGNGLIMTDAAIQFLAEVFRGESLKIEIGIDSISKVGFDLYYRFVNTEKEATVAKVKTGMLLFDYELKRLASISEVLRSKLQNL